MKKFILSVLFMCVLSQSVFAWDWYKKWRPPSLNSRVNTNTTNIGRLDQKSQNTGQRLNSNEVQINANAVRISTLESTTPTGSTSIITRYPAYGNGERIGNVRLGEPAGLISGSQLLTNLSSYLQFNPEFEEVAIGIDGLNFGMVAIIYDNLNCTGTPYLVLGPYPNGIFNLLEKRLGKIYKVEDSLFYYPATWVALSSAEIPVKGSKYGMNGQEYCQDITSSYSNNYFFIELLPNDPAVTGITYPLPLPITFGSTPQ